MLERSAEVRLWAIGEGIHFLLVLSFYPLPTHQGTNTTLQPSQPNPSSPYFLSPLALDPLTSTDLSNAESGNPQAANNNFSS